jgi:hypothetical protein
VFIQLAILLVGILLALALPGGAVLFLMWIQSNRAKKQRELLKKLKAKKKRIKKELLGKQQSIYMRSKKNKKK